MKTWKAPTEEILLKVFFSCLHIIGWEYMINRVGIPYIFSQNDGNLFELFSGKERKIKRKLKKEIEIYIRKNSKKILGGYSDGKFDKRV